MLKIIYYNNNLKLKIIIFIIMKINKIRFTKK